MIIKKKKKNNPIDIQRVPGSVGSGDFRLAEVLCKKQLSCIVIVHINLYSIRRGVLLIFG